MTREIFSGWLFRQSWKILPQPDTITCIPCGKVTDPHPIGQRDVRGTMCDLSNMASLRFFSLAQPHLVESVLYASAATNTPSQSVRRQSSGWISKHSQKKQAGTTHHRKRPPTLLQLADTKGLQLCQPPRLTQVLGMWKNQSWGSRLPLSTEGINPSHPTVKRCGQSNCIVWVWKTDILSSFRVSQRVLTWAY